MRWWMVRSGVLVGAFLRDLELKVPKVTFPSQGSDLKLPLRFFFAHLGLSNYPHKVYKKLSE